MIGMPVGYTPTGATAFNLESNTNVVTECTENTVLNPGAGSVIINMEKKKVERGFFYILKMTADGSVIIAEEPIKIERKMRFTELAYELTSNIKPSDNLLSFPSDSLLKHPEQLPSLKGIDNQHLHVVIPTFAEVKPHTFITLQNGHK